MEPIIISFCWEGSATQGFDVGTVCQCRELYNNRRIYNFMAEPVLREGWEKQTQTIMLALVTLLGIVGS